MDMTMEQAIANAEMYEQEYQEAKTIWETSNSRPSTSIEKRIAFRRMKDAETMLKWYKGDYRKRYNNDGSPMLNRDGRQMVECLDIGVIKKLANQAQRLREESNLGARFLNRTFGNFDKSREPQAFDLCRKYVDRDNLFAEPHNGLMLLGGVGTGKTHLAAAIANTFVERGIVTLFATFSEHLENIRTEFDHVGRKEYLAKMKSVPVLVIDDLGKERKTEWSQQILFDVINSRYEHMLPTIITTNFNEDGLANHAGGAVWSRLYEMCSGVKTRSGDYRRGQ